MGTVFRIPKPEKRVLISLRMDKKNLCEITKSAKKIGISRNEWIVQAIEYAINSMEQEENVDKNGKIKKDCEQLFAVLFVLLLSFGKPVFYSVAFLRAFCIVKMLERTDQIAGNAADTLDWLICRFFAVAVRALVSNDAGIAADWVAVDRMIDRAVTDAGFFHAADELLKSVHVLKRVAV